MFTYYLKWILMILLVLHKQNVPLQITENTKILHTNRQEKPGETNKETYRCVRPEQVNNSPIFMLARWWW
jgi:hypothetical protein